MHQPEVLPEVPDDGLLVKTLYAGICHVDKDVATGEPIVAETHNVCGKVLAIGGKISEAECDIRVGDVIVIYPWPGCGQCETCSAGNSHLCDDDDVIAIRSPRTVGSHGDDKVTSQPSGRLANFQVVLDWQHAVRLPREVPPQVGCQLPCGGLRVYAAMLDARPSFEQAIRVRGFANLLVVCSDRADGLETWCVQILKSVFCERNVKVVCVGPRRDILDRAVESGADDVVHLEYPPLPTSASSSTSPSSTADVDASILTQLVDQTTMSGYNRMDVAIDLSGDPISFLVAVRSLHRGGTVFELGTHHRPHTSSHSLSHDLPPTTPSSAAVPMAELVARSVTLRPITAGSVALLRQLVDVVGIQRIGVDVAAVECFPPDDVRTAIDRYQKHLATGPVVIKYD